MPAEEDLVPRIALEDLASFDEAELPSHIRLTAAMLRLLVAVATDDLIRVPDILRVPSRELEDVLAARTLPCSETMIHANEPQSFIQHFVRVCGARIPVDSSAWRGPASRLRGAADDDRKALIVDLADALFFHLMEVE